MFFASDNTSGAAPEIMAALVRANDGYQRSYGADTLMDRTRDRVREVVINQKLEGLAEGYLEELRAAAFIREP